MSQVLVCAHWAPVLFCPFTVLVLLSPSMCTTSKPKMPFCPPVISFVCPLKGIARTQVPLYLPWVRPWCRHLRSTFCFEQCGSHSIWLDIYICMHVYKLQSHGCGKHKAGATVHEDSLLSYRYLLIHCTIFSENCSCAQMFLLYIPAECYTRRMLMFEG